MAVDIRVGTSGYSYEEWRGTFYPAEMPAAQMLAHYAGRLPSVEINNTFYRMPSATTLEKWHKQVPESFLFVLKAPQQITHSRRLRDVAEPVNHFYKVARSLGDRRGPALFQLPPYLKKDLPRLNDFLATIPDGERLAIEFRHESWYDDAVYSALEARKVALGIADVDEPETSTPRQATAKWGYVRLRRSHYSTEQLQTFHGWLQAQSWDQVFVFFKHEDSGKGPALAEELLKIVRAI